DTMGIQYKIDKGIVRGLDYYTKTVFEFVSDNFGAQGTVCGGGRYDGLVEELGGKPTPGMGFGLGLERALMVMENCGVEIPEDNGPDVFIASIGEGAEMFVSSLVNDLRKQGIKAERDLLARSVKAQMKFADKLGASYTTVIGDDEIKEGKVNLKNMSDGSSVNIEISQLASEVLK
ncbi:MAG: His/Gly/Thr/Pro-type tRNA ligase C-terminal domain-containing protein, partial [Eubacteriales bacterium]|nr:His/Gly/Thr/Pro-type tRNA ligase C-terminal domain-containing protein [Eubacteriales bacterium]